MCPSSALPSDPRIPMMCCMGPSLVVGGLVDLTGPLSG